MDEKALEAAARAAAEETYPHLVGLWDDERCLSPKFRKDFRDIARAAIEAYEKAKSATGEWRDIETNYALKGRCRSPAYFPATGEVCEVSGPNCDDENGYTWLEMEILWQNELFVLYGAQGFWPNLNKREHIAIRPLPTAPEGGV